MLTNLHILEQHEFEKISRQFKEHPQVRLVLKYDEALSHEIFAAADIFLIPSIFEPCGLTQVGTLMIHLLSLCFLGGS